VHKNEKVAPKAKRGTNYHGALQQNSLKQMFVMQGTDAVTLIQTYFMTLRPHHTFLSLRSYHTFLQ
jgi:hypothetical protein